MKSIINLKSISEINNFVKNKTKHPLVAVVDFSKLDGHFEEGTRISCDFYSVMFKNHCSNKIKYGRETYDFQDGSLVCLLRNKLLLWIAKLKLCKT